MYKLSEIAQMLDCKIPLPLPDPAISELVYDSRKTIFPPVTLFFALIGSNRQGTDFIPALYQKGQRYFVVPHSFDDTPYAEGYFLKVPDVLAALQHIAAVRRSNFKGEVVGITGSNGKTIVKEWLYQLLHSSADIYKSPRSFNSQIGVPVSVWQIPDMAEIALIEAGISLKGEMPRLEKIIRPTKGIFTSIGDAHAAGFESFENKIEQKLQLFLHASEIVFPGNNQVLLNSIQAFKKNQNPGLKLLYWGFGEDATLWVKKLEQQDLHSLCLLQYKGQEMLIKIPFTDALSIDNVFTCICYILCCTQFDLTQLQDQLLKLQPLSMRMELKEGINGCTIINDSYSNDLQSLKLGLDYLKHQQRQGRHSIILSSMLQTGIKPQELYSRIADMLKPFHLYRFIGIGSELLQYRDLFKDFARSSFYASTDELIGNLPSEEFYNEAILLKGARTFHFETLLPHLELKLHLTVLEINLDSLRHNLNVYKSLLQQDVGIMCMVKAFSYGSGSSEVAGLLQHAGVKYLAVAYTDEGVELRKSGIKLPMMVMNAEEQGFASIIQYQLEPELYSFAILEKFAAYLKLRGSVDWPVHIKIDTGMHRLGFLPNEVEKLAKYLKACNQLKVASVFSHLAASDMPEMDGFTMLQYTRLVNASAILEQQLGYGFIKHIANTSAISRLPQLQMNMVRLGIGLYGVDSNPEVQQALQNVTTLKTTIAQIKTLPGKETIGYSRAGTLRAESQIATVRIGYADGYRRSFGKGVGKMMVNGQLAPVIGHVCMDMTMLDITGITAKEGDEVIVFGTEPFVGDLAAAASTIPYEILTNISQRVKRIYFGE